MSPESGTRVGVRASLAPQRNGPGDGRVSGGRAHVHDSTVRGQPAPWPHPRIHTWSNNWLVHRILSDHLTEVVPRYARGVLVDIGCGEKPWLPLFAPWVDDYIGVDHARSPHDLSRVDVVATAFETTLPAASAHTVLSLAVLEHLEDPQRAVSEAARLLKPGGHLILAAPMIWHVHEEPRDFFRFTRFGLEHLIEQAGLEVVELRPLSGFVVTFSQELCYALSAMPHWRAVRPLVALATFAIQRVAYWLRPWDRTHRFTWMNLAVARK